MNTPHPTNYKTILSIQVHIVQYVNICIQQWENTHTCYQHYNIVTIILIMVTAAFLEMSYNDRFKFSQMAFEFLACYFPIG
jgi:hypothetical protein